MRNEHGCCNHGFGFGVFRIVGLVVGGLVVAVFFALAFGWLVMQLWDWLMPNLFGLKAITYWQAFGLVVLAKLLFGGHSFHSKHHHGHRFSKFHKHGFCKGDGNDDDDWSAGGDYRNWKHYHTYWKERGKKDFEEYLKETGKLRKENEEDTKK